VAVTEPDVLLELRRLAELVRESDQQIDHLIASARARGCTWSQLGRAMEESPDTVRMRMSRRRRMPVPRRPPRHAAGAGHVHEEAM
jgi:hypothetical protein